MSFDLSNAPLPFGSGQFGTECERMQAANATAPCGGGAAAGLEAPHADATRTMPNASPTVAAIATVRFTLSMVAAADNSRRSRL